MAQRFEFVYDPDTGRIISPDLLANSSGASFGSDVIGVADGYETDLDYGIPEITIQGNPIQPWATHAKTIGIPGVPGIGGLSLPAFGSPNFYLMLAALIVTLAAFGASFKEA